MNSVFHRVFVGQTSGRIGPFSKDADNSVVEKVVTVLRIATEEESNAQELATKTDVSELCKIIVSSTSET